MAIIKYIIYGLLITVIGVIIGNAIYVIARAIKGDIDDY
jgi:hypothetical protein